MLTCGTYGNVIRFLPPLSITDELLHEGLDVVAAALADSVTPVPRLRRSAGRGILTRTVPARAAARPPSARRIGRSRRRSPT